MSSSSLTVLHRGHGDVRKRRPVTLDALEDRAVLPVQLCQAGIRPDVPTPHIPRRHSGKVNVPQEAIKIVPELDLNPRGCAIRGVVLPPRANLCDHWKRRSQ
jgi:hypothetical protein